MWWCQDSLSLLKRSGKEGWDKGPQAAGMKASLETQATHIVLEKPEAKGDACFVDCIVTHRETGASPWEEEPGLRSQVERRGNR